MMPEERPRLPLSSQHPTQALEAKVAELERFCGQLAMENTALKKTLRQLPSRNGTQ